MKTPTDLVGLTAAYSDGTTFVIRTAVNTTDFGIIVSGEGHDQQLKYVTIVPTKKVSDSPAKTLEQLLNCI